MMAVTGLVQKEKAEELLASISNQVARRAIRLLIEDVETFYLDNPSRLVGGFDIGFLAEMLAEDIGELAAFSCGFVPASSTQDTPYRPEPSKMELGVNITIWQERLNQARNYIAMHRDEWIGAALWSLIARADLKEKLLNPRIQEYGGGTPTKPGTPVVPMDYLFMVVAMERALEPGRPARLALEKVDSPS